MTESIRQQTDQTFQFPSDHPPSASVRSILSHIGELSNEDPCPICREPSNQPMILPFNCTHRFHRSCMIEWRDSGVGVYACPTCRNDESRGRAEQLEAAPAQITLHNRNIAEQFSNNLEAYSRSNVDNRNTIIASLRTVQQQLAHLENAPTNTSQIETIQQQLRTLAEASIEAAEQIRQQSGQLGILEALQATLLNIQTDMERQQATANLQPAAINHQINMQRHQIQTYTNRINQLETQTGNPIGSVLATPFGRRRIGDHRDRPIHNLRLPNINLSEETKQRLLGGIVLASFLLLTYAGYREGKNIWAINGGYRPTFRSIDINYPFKEQIKSLDKLSIPNALKNLKMSDIKDLIVANQYALKLTTLSYLSAKVSNRLPQGYGVTFGLVGPTMLFWLFTFIHIGTHTAYDGVTNSYNFTKEHLLNSPLKSAALIASLPIAIKMLKSFVIVPPLAYTAYLSSKNSYLFLTFLNEAMQKGSPLPGCSLYWPEQPSVMLHVKGTGPIDRYFFIRVSNASGPIWSSE